MVGVLSQAIRAGDSKQALALIRQHPDVLLYSEHPGQTWLHLAAQKGMSELVELLLQRGFDVNAPGTDFHPLTSRNTPLHLAAMSGNARLVRLLIEAGADLNTTDSQHQTALHLAMEGSTGQGGGYVPPDLRRGRHEVIRELIVAGADLFAQPSDSKRASPMNLILNSGDHNLITLALTLPPEPNARSPEGNSLLHLAAARQHAVAIADLTRRGAAVNATNSAGLTPLHLLALSVSPRQAGDAAQLPGYEILLQHGAIPDVFTLSTCGELGELARLLEKHPGKTTQRDSLGRTPLHWAASIGKEHSLALLLQHTADANTTNLAGRLPLHEAAERGFAEVVRLLIPVTVPTGALDAGGDSPLALAARRGHEPVVRLLMAVSLPGAAGLDESLALHKAVLSGQTNLVGMVRRAGASLTTTNAEGLMPLHFACQQGTTPVVDLLLELGADANAPDAKGRTPLDHALARGAGSVVKSLLNHGASARTLSADALLGAIRYQNEDLLALLLRHGASPNATNAHGQTLLHMAAQGRRPQVIELLLGYQANLQARDTNGNTALHIAMAGHILGNGPPEPDDDRAHLNRLRVRQAVANVVRHFSPPPAPWCLTDAEIAWRKANPPPVESFWTAYPRLAFQARLESFARWFAVSRRPQAVMSLQQDWKRWETYPWRYLIAVGADVNATNHLGQAAIHLLAVRPMGERVEPARLEEAFRLLLRNGADVNQLDAAGSSPLHYAAWAKSDLLARQLLANGTRLAALDAKGNTPVHSALSPDREWNGAEPLLNTLFAAGGSADTPDATGRTPVHYLAAMKWHNWRNNAAAVHLVLNHSTNVNAADLQGDTALHLAVRAELPELIQALAAARADYSLKNRAGLVALNQPPDPAVRSFAVVRQPDGTVRTNFSPSLRLRSVFPPGARQDLVSAARSGDLDSLRSYLRMDPSLATHPLAGGITLARLAASSGNRAAVQLLLDHGATNDLFTAAATGNLELLKTLLAGQTDGAKEPEAMRMPPNTTQAPLLHSIISSQDENTLAWFLTLKPDLNALDHHGHSALGRALGLPNQKLVELLQAAGARPSLFDAVFTGNVEWCRELVKTHPDLLTQTNRLGHTALHAAMTLRGNSATSSGPFPVTTEQLAQIREVLTGAAVRPEKPQLPANTLLHSLESAIRMRDDEPLKAALDDGLNINSHREPDGFALLHLAIAHDRIDTAKWLLDRGANPDAQSFDELPGQLDTFRGQRGYPRRHSGSTPLHVAVHFQNLPMIQLLLARGANINATNLYGQTPLTYHLRMTRPATRPVSAATRQSLWVPYRSAPVVMSPPMLGSQPVPNIELVLRKHGAREGEAFPTWYTPPDQRTAQAPGRNPIPSPP